VQIGQCIQQVGTQHHYVERGLIDPENSLVIERRHLASRLEECWTGHLAGILGKRNHEGLSPSFVLLAQVAETELGLIRGGKEQPLISESESARRSELTCRVGGMPV